MEKTEKILVVMVILGQLMRLLDISGGGILSIAMAILLSLFYIVLGFALFNSIRFTGLFKKGNLKSKEVALSILLGFALAFSLMGIVFKLQILQEGPLMLWVGIILLVFSFLILWRFWKNTSFYKKIFPRIVAYGSIAIILVVVPASWLVDIYFYKYPDYAEQLKEKLKNPDGIIEFYDEKKRPYPYENKNQ